MARAAPLLRGWPPSPGARAEWLNLVLDLDLAGFLEDQGSLVWPTMGSALRSTDMAWDEPGLSWIVYQGCACST